MRPLAPEVAELVTGKTVVLDTNAFVEGYSNPQEFSSLLGGLAGLDCALTTIEAIRIEFLSKNRSVDELTKKINFYNQALTYPELPNATFAIELKEPSLLFAFGCQAHNFKAVDFMLAAVLKKYAANTLLLTNDHHDFTPALFTLATLLPLLPEAGGVIPFGLYSFSEEKYAQILTKNAKP